MTVARIYLAPGMFGFARLAAFDYFAHVQVALERRYAAKGRRAQVRVCELHPTASIRRRAARLAELLDETAGDDTGPIHLLGHSTGGLDARLVASPAVHLGATTEAKLGWVARLRSVTTMNTPHYGTPMASFFATAKGQQLLYALSAMTVAGLKLGAPPLAVGSALVAALGRTGDHVGVELALVDKLTEAVSQLLDDAASRSLREWLRQVRDDQGGVVQLMPEAMDMFHAAVTDRPGVRYQSVASYVARGGMRDWLAAVRSPWAVVSAALFQLMYRIAAQRDERYPCAPQDDGEPMLRRLLGEVPDPHANDGVVPIRSQLYGEPVWIGQGDHLDVMGHFSGPCGHNDWLASGARFDLLRFDAMMDRVVDGMLAAERRAGAPS